MIASMLALLSIPISRIRITASRNTRHIPTIPYVQRCARPERSAEAQATRADLPPAGSPCAASVPASLQADREPAGVSTASSCSWSTRHAIAAAIAAAVSSSGVGVKVMFIGVHYTAFARMLNQRSYRLEIGPRSLLYAPHSLPRSPDGAGVQIAGVVALQTTQPHQQKIPLPRHAGGDRGGASIFWRSPKDAVE